MKKFLLLLCLSGLLFSINLRAQQVPDTALLRSMMLLHPPQPLKVSDMIQLSALPELPVPEQYRNHKSTLPSSVDNSLQPYFRPIGWQQGYECGQSAGIAYNFTYEVDRLRNVPANVPENQFVTHFAWDFLNNGQQYVGASAFDGYEVVRAAGTPQTTEYGGLMWSGLHTRWMSGYNLYYSSMHNRINDAYQIQVGTPDGLLILKQWLYDHLEGSAVGGVANFYSGYGSPNATLPAGTPDSGKTVYTTWGGTSHTWTVCGYNDSIRYDVNGDGQYTNNIDINSDGMVDMKDWEIGGFKLANGYGGGGWGNSGFTYALYRCLALDNGNGGIWNHAVFVIKIKQTCDPQLTYKVTMKHTCRNMLKVIAGIALNTAATKPEFYLDFPIFNYQGGALYMQGDTTEAAKTIEFGLDCSSLLGHVSSGQQVKYFLDVYEKDPSASNTGEVVNFSVIDYAGGFHETQYGSTNIPISNNDTTRLALLKTVSFNKVGIVTDSLPAAPINEPYSAQLTASGGSLPYRWDFDWTAAESSTTEPFPTTSAHKLVFSNNDYGFSMQNLQFTFPFCGQSFNHVYANPDGFLKFDNGSYTYPYLVDGDLLFKNTKIIGAFVANLFLSTGQGVWYEGDEYSATFRWKASVNGQSGTDVNVAIKLFPSGKIELYYGTISVASDQHWLSGFSMGQFPNYQFTHVSGIFSGNTTPFKVTLDFPKYPSGLSLSEDGILSGTTGIELQGSLLKFRVTDNDNVWSTKVIPFSTKGILITYTVQSGGDTIVQAGETASLTMKLKNIGTTALTNASLRISENDSTVLLNDSTEFIGTLAAGDSVILPNALSFTVNSTVFEGHVIDMNTCIASATDTFNSVMRIIVHSFILEASSVSIADGNNNSLEPGETAAMIIELKNVGGATATNIHVAISCGDPYINISSATAYIDTLALYGSKNMFFIISASSLLPDRRIVVFNLDITASNGYHTHDFVVLVIGDMGETFETGDFTAFPWVLTGDSNWYVQGAYVYAGADAARSGPITHSMTSSLTVPAYIIDDGKIFFQRKVQCEADNTNHNYDWLAFYIDGVEMERWDGDKNWAQMSYDVTAGNHTFKWTYNKDYSVSTGLDAGFLDDIIFPAIGDPNPLSLITPLSIYKTIEVNSVDSQLVNITNTGTGLIVFTSAVDYINSPAGIDWCLPKYYAGNIDPAQTFSNDIMFYSAGLTVGIYNCNLRINKNSLVETTIPVTLEVIPQSISIAENTPDDKINISPNPFSDRTTLTFDFARQNKLSIDILDAGGRLIRTLLDGQEIPSGKTSMVWDGTGNNGEAVSAGLYFCRIMTGDEVKVFRLARVH